MLVYDPPTDAVFFNQVFAATQQKTEVLVLKSSADVRTFELLRNQNQLQADGTSWSLKPASDEP